jgi:hypothetical protein
MTIADIEDVLLQTHQDLGVFAQVVSFGREGEPNVLALPAALIYFDESIEAEHKGRPIDRIAFIVAIRVQNLASEAAAARDAYSLMNVSMAAVRGKVLGITDIEPFSCAGRKLTDYNESGGWIEYSIRYATRHYLPVVTE